IMKNDGKQAKLKEEIEAELDKISISSLEKEDIASDSISETQSDGSDTDLDELPESVLHCINIIKNKSKTAEELILQDLEDADVLNGYKYGFNYRTVSNNDMHLRIELSTEYQENSEQLMKILSKIEKEEFLRSKTHCASSESAPEADPHDLPVGEHVFPDDTDINFGYCEVEERCRRSFEAWQHKQKELEDQERETLKAQKDREEKQFQEDEEKRHCWLKQFEVEKKKLENIQKTQQHNNNHRFHSQSNLCLKSGLQFEEFIKNLHLQVEQERARFKDLQEKEKMRLLKLQHDAAIKIQANYKAFLAYQKYSPIIKERVENKKKKAQEWKDKEAKIRQNILRLEREQVLLKEKLRIREDTGKQLTSETLKKGEHNSKHLTVEGTSKNKNDIAKTLGDEKSKYQEDTPLWLVIDEKSNMRESVGRQLVLKEPIQEQLKQYISNQTILAELKEEEKNENLPKQQYSEKLTSLKTKYENIDKQLELESPDLKENVKEQLKLQELKSQIQKEGKLKHATDENVEQKRQILEHNQEINETGNNETQKIIKDNQQKKVQEIEKEKIPEQNGTLHEENSISMISMKQKLLPLELESSENVGKVLQEEEINLKSNKIENSKGNALNSDIVIFNTSDTINIETTIHKQDCILNRQAHCENSSIYNAKSSLVSKEANSVKSEIKEIPEDCHENRSEREGNMTCSIPEPTLLSSIEEKRLAWMKSFKPWFEIFMKHQQKKIVKKKRSVKCPANTLPPLNILEILQCGPWNTLQQVFLV
uniref:Leucine rich repeats and IQ motif containing 1 n=1 Tax=Loxodonta africana TaxID=9785 RepID=G3TMA2_LOXAF